MSCFNNSAEINVGAFLATGTNVVRLFILEKDNNSIFLIISLGFSLSGIFAEELYCMTKYVLGTIRVSATA